MGKWMAHGGQPCPGTGCPVADIDNIYFIWNNLGMGDYFCICPSW